MGLGVLEGDKKKATGSIVVIWIIHDRGVTLVGVIGNYLHRWVAPLMARRFTFV